MCRSYNTIIIGVGMNLEVGVLQEPLGGLGAYAPPEKIEN